MVIIALDFPDKDTTIKFLKQLFNNFGNLFIVS